MYVRGPPRLDADMREYLEQLSDKLANKGQARREGKPVTGTYN